MIQTFPAVTRSPLADKGYRQTDGLPATVI